MAKEFERPLSVLLRTAFIGCIIVPRFFHGCRRLSWRELLLGGRSEHFIAYANYVRRGS